MTHAELGVYGPIVTGYAVRVVTVIDLHGATIEIAMRCIVTVIAYDDARSVYRLGTSAMQLHPVISACVYQ